MLRERQKPPDRVRFRWHDARMEPFVLANEFVRLSVPTASDVDDVYAACQDDAIQRWTTVPSPYRPEHASGFVGTFVVQGWASGQNLTWAVRPPGAVPVGAPERPLVGMIGLSLDDAPAVCRSAEIGFWMVADARGHGLLTHAARLVLDYAFDPEGLDLVRAEWRAAVGNWASRRVAWKLGFRVEAQVRGLLVSGDAREDGWIGTMLASDPREPNEPWPTQIV
jgi:RimJ/RimL family protein N-acetyltransferase